MHIRITILVVQDTHTTCATHMLTGHEEDDLGGSISQNGINSVITPKSYNRSFFLVYVTDQYKMGRSPPSHDPGICALITCCTSSTPSWGLLALMEGKRKRIVYKRFYMPSLEMMHITSAHILLPRAECMAPSNCEES